MKTTIALFALLLSSTAFARGERLVCTQYDRQTNLIGQRTVVLMQTSAGTLSDGHSAAFEAEIFDGAATYTATTYAGTASVEDVAFSFQSADGKVGFSLYLDEMNEASLTLDGQDAGDFVCRRATFVCSQYDRSSEKLLNRTVTLTQTSGDGLSEGETLGFDLALFDGAETYTETVLAGTAEIEDVVFAFTSADGRAAFGLYLDEAGESSLRLDGADAGDYVCR